MFVLSAPGRLQDLLEAGGFVDVTVETVATSRWFATVTEYVEEIHDTSSMFGEVFDPLSADQREEVRQTIGELAEPYAAVDGSLTLPGRSLVAAAEA
jgi:hypothetical protein